MLSFLGEGKSKVPKKQAAVAVPSFQKKTPNGTPKKEQAKNSCLTKKNRYNPSVPGINTIKCVTLPETNIAPAHRLSQKDGLVFQPFTFRCHVSFREGSSKWKPEPHAVAGPELGS